MAKADPTRLLAFDVLRAVAEQDAYANLELSRLLRERRLSARDAALATELVSGTLRMRRAYDLVLDRLLRGPVDDAVRDALRLGVHQLLALRVADHAAVTTTVELVRARIGHRPTGLVNAVLRRVAERSLTEWLEGAGLAARTSHPDWVVDELSAALGRPEELPALLEADNAAPRVTLVARPGLAEVEELVAQGGTPVPGVRYAVQWPGGDPGSLAAVREGRAGVQDAGSQLVAMLLASAPVQGPDRRWLDLCAGPGGKAALLAALAAQRGAGLLAHERQPHRAALVAGACRAVPRGPGGGLVGVVAGDGRFPSWRPESFDRILLDAPCTGLGALRRRPEARWRRRPEDLATLVGLQRDLLEVALDSVRPGGLVGYATCSPALDETVGVVGGVLERRGEVALVPAEGLLEGLGDAAVPALPGAVQLWPHRHGTDAMFLALLRRVG